MTGFRPRLPDPGDATPGPTPPGATGPPVPHHPLRVAASFDAERRSRIVARRHHLADELRKIDDHLADVTRRRLLILAELEATRDELWPRHPFRHGRRPPPFDDPPLPPVHADAKPLHGRGLRWTCLALLARHGTLTLRQLHALLHDHGYDVSGDRPVKALGDALGWEATCGRVRRVGHGTYQLDPQFRPRRGRFGDPRSVALDPLGGSPLSGSGFGFDHPAGDVDVHDDPGDWFSAERPRPDHGPAPGPLRR